mmetsp:Transcript_99056/g.279878  ORF Transcript_99056/g.279878 Transcript_99056/m.279878 type:complete len:234 (+) Transcript_99056:970-1671(+)
MSAHDVHARPIPPSCEAQSHPDHGTNDQLALHASVSAVELQIAVDFDDALPHHPPGGTAAHVDLVARELAVERWVANLEGSTAVVDHLRHRLRHPSSARAGVQVEPDWAEHVAAGQALLHADDVGWAVAPAHSREALPRRNIVLRIAGEVLEVQGHDGQLVLVPPCASLTIMVHGLWGHAPALQKPHARWPVAFGQLLAALKRNRPRIAVRSRRRRSPAWSFAVTRHLVALSP